MVSTRRECSDYIQSPVPGFVRIPRSTCGVLCFNSVISVIFVGFAVFAGFTSLQAPYANFENLFHGSSTNLNAYATALVKTNSAFYGWSNTFSVLGEIRSTYPAKTARDSGLISIALVTVLFFLVNVTYVATVPIDEIKNSGQLVAGLMFKHVFGENSWATKLLSVRVALSCLGNIVRKFLNAFMQRLTRLSSDRHRESWFVLQDVDINDSRRPSVKHAFYAKWQGKVCCRTRSSSRPRVPSAPPWGPFSSSPLSP